jgi:N-formylglutamate amidohydrolase
MSDKELKLAEMKARKDQVWDAYHAAQRLLEATWDAWEDAHAEYEAALRMIEE